MTTSTGAESAPAGMVMVRFPSLEVSEPPVGPTVSRTGVPTYCFEGPWLAGPHEELAVASASRPRANAAGPRRRGLAMAKNGTTRGTRRHGVCGDPGRRQQLGTCWNFGGFLGRQRAHPRRTRPP